MYEFTTQLFKDRAWSWPIVGLVIMISALILRHLILRDFLRDLKRKSKEWYKKTNSAYQKRSIWGWISFGISVTGLILLWRFEPFFLSYLNLACWLLLFVTFLILSFLFHLQAYLKVFFGLMTESPLGETKEPSDSC